MSKIVDTGNLPSRQGSKKQKVDLSTLDLSTFDAVPSESTIFTDPSVIEPKPSRTCTTSIAWFTSSGPLSTCQLNEAGVVKPPSLLSDFDLAWQKAKEVVDYSDIENSFELYVREFEKSTVYDLFKVALHKVLP